MYKIIFWQNIVSPHFIPVLRALSFIDSVEVLLIAENFTTPERAAMGWVIPDTGKATVIIAPSKIEIKKIISDNKKNALHIFSGTRGYAMVWMAFKESIRQKATTAIVGETGDWIGVKGMLRVMRTRLDSFLFGSKISAVLAIGERGERWYQAGGYPKEKIFSWAYFVDPPTFVEETPLLSSDYKIIYVGRLSKEKGLDKLIAALGEIQDRFIFKIIGDGPEKGEIEKLIEKFNLEQKTEIINFIPHKEVFQEMADADLMILPSTGKDGWGAVVNEALMVGTPVICSSNCGAIDLLKDVKRGDIFDPKEPETLKEIIIKRIRKGKVNTAERDEIKKWTKKIEADQAAAYLFEIKEYIAGRINKRPIAPWYS